MSTKNSEEIELRVDFDKEDSKKFRELQDVLGIKNKSEVIRFCLTFTHTNYPKKIISPIKNPKKIKNENHQDNPLKTETEA